MKYLQGFINKKVEIKTGQHSVRGILRKVEQSAHNGGNVLLETVDGRIIVVRGSKIVKIRSFQGVLR